MEKIIRIPAFCILSIIISLTTISSGQWKKVTPAPMDGVYGIYFVNSSLGWASGAYGAIYKTTDGGNNWREIYRDANAGDLKEVFFLNSNVGFIAGSGARMLKTINGGTSWTPVVISGLTIEIKSVYFADENTGWILTDNGVLRTTDGGNNWNSVLTLTGLTMYKFSFWNSNHAVAVGKNSSELYYTKDGITWTKSATVPLGGYSYSKSDIRDVFGVDDKNVYAVGWGSLVGGSQPSILVKSTDGGATWNFLNQETANITYENIYSVWFKDANNGVAAGGGGRGSVILRTTDGGKNWLPVDIYCGSTLSTIVGNGNNFWVSGSGGMIMYSPDLGATWQQQSFNPGVTLSSIKFLSDKAAVSAGGDCSFYKSTDGGKNWIGKYLRINGIAPDIQDIYFVNENTGFASFSYGLLAKTTDAGNTWKAVIQDSQDPTFSKYGIFFTDEKTGFVVGKEGTKIDAIYKTTDGGNNWSSKINQFQANLRGVAFADKFKGIVVGEKLKAAYTTDGGDTWTASKFNGVPAGKTPNIIKVSFLDNNNAVATGDACIFRSSDSGANWDYITVTDLSESLTGLVFKDNLKGWTVGTSNATPKRNGMYETQDGGKTWSYNIDLSVFKSSESLTNITIDKNNMLWVCGPKGSVYTNSVTVGVETTKEKFPQNYSLKQNYPNPFNPSTNIEYFIPEMSYVKLNVYDMLGRLVSILVDEYQNSGNHKINFNASELTSGIYFYSLNTNGFVAIKKMLLIK
ncbi:MAG: YCF48-related protein [Ignavibacteriales bacterium]